MCHTLLITPTDWEADDDFHPDDTNLADDFEKSEFLDLSRPLLRQVWQANFRSVVPCTMALQS
jgi:4-hydroxysphinganine ceramide fatty acyl 2-hydroxylase